MIDRITLVKISLWIIPAVMVFHPDAVIAEAFETKIGGQFRPRWEYRDRDFNKSTEPFEAVDFRLRLDFNTQFSDSFNTFFQVASEPVLGSESPDQVRIHQAYFNYEEFLGVPVDVRLGRQEIVLDGHRIFGNDGWDQDGRTHDGATLTNKGEKYTLKLIYSKLTEQGDELTSDSEDDTAYALWYQLRDFIIPKQKLSLYFLFVNLNQFNKVSPAFSSLPVEDNNDNDLFMGGVRQAGKLGSFDYRVEFYYEFGTDELRAQEAGGGTDLNAFLFGARLGYEFRDLPLKPHLTLWYDYVSGDDGTGDVTAFASPFITTHKFYGFMDRFISLNAKARNRGDGFLNSGLMGLHDLAVKASFQPFKKIRFLADYHYFLTAEKLALGGPGVADTSLLGERKLGHELDLTLVYQYNSAMNLVFGFSRFWANRLMQISDPNFGEDNANWAYMMIDVKF